MNELKKVFNISVITNSTIILPAGKSGEAFIVNSFFLNYILLLIFSLIAFPGNTN